MSKPVFEDLFKFSGRRNRQSFIYLQLVSLFTVIVGTGVVIAMSAAAPVAATLFFAVGLAAFVVIVLANWAAASQRIRDFGQSGVWALIMFIPYVGPLFGLALWLIPSNPGDNKYGADPTVSPVVTA